MNSVFRYFITLIILLSFSKCTDNSTESNNGDNYYGAWKPTTENSILYLDSLGVTSILTIGSLDEENKIKIRMNDALGCTIYTPELIESAVNFSPYIFNYEIQFETYKTAKLTVESGNSERTFEIYKTDIVPNWSPCL